MQLTVHDYMTFFNVKLTMNSRKTKRKLQKNTYGNNMLGAAILFLFQDFRVGRIIKVPRVHWPWNGKVTDKFNLINIILFKYYLLEINTNHFYILLQMTLFSKTHKVTILWWYDILKYLSKVRLQRNLCKSMIKMKIIKKLLIFTAIIVSDYHYSKLCSKVGTSSSSRRYNYTGVVWHMHAKKLIVVL